MQGDRAEPLAVARRLLAETGTAALATLDPAGAPFASYVTLAPGADGAPLLLLSRLAVHTRNLAADPRASLLLVREADRGQGRLAAERLSLSGEVAVAADQDAARALFLARHPDAGGYSRFADFAFYRLAVTGGHLVAGFGVIVDLAAADLTGI